MMADPFVEIPEQCGDALMLIDAAKVHPEYACNLAGELTQDEAQAAAAVLAIKLAQYL